jgi:hypothetical protein
MTRPAACQRQARLAFGYTPSQGSGLVLKI